MPESVKRECKKSSWLPANLTVIADPSISRPLADAAKLNPTRHGKNPSRVDLLLCQAAINHAGPRLLISADKAIQAIQAGKFASEESGSFLAIKPSKKMQRHARILQRRAIRES